MKDKIIEELEKDSSKNRIFIISGFFFVATCFLGFFVLSLLVAYFSKGKFLHLFGSAFFYLVGFLYLRHHFKLKNKIKTFRNLDTIGYTTTATILNYLSKQISESSTKWNKTQAKYTTYYYAILSFNRDGQTIICKDYTPYTKAEIDYLLTFDTLKIKYYNNVCKIDINLDGVEQYKENETTKQEEQENSTKDSIHNKITMSDFSSHTTPAAFIASLIFLIIAIGCLIGFLIHYLTSSSVQSLIIACFAGFATIFMLFAFVPNLKDILTIKKGVPKYAEEYELLGSSETFTTVKIKFLNKNNELRTCKVNVDRFLAIKMSSIEKLPILVHKNRAFPDQTRIIKELDKIM